MDGQWYGEGLTSANIFRRNILHWRRLLFSPMAIALQLLSLCSITSGNEQATKSVQIISLALLNAQLNRGTDETNFTSA